jgi:hypothetical protein
MARSIFIPKVTASDLAALDYFTPLDAIIRSGDRVRSVNRNNHPLINFPDDADGAVYFPAVMGKDYGGSTILLDVFWTADASVGNVLWLVTFERDNDSNGFPGIDLNVDAWGTQQGVVSPAPPSGVGQALVRKATFAFAPADVGFLQPGDPYRVRLRRNGGVPPDTMSGDAQFFRASVEALP